jgi:hypothetical protein
LSYPDYALILFFTKRVILNPLVVKDRLLRAGGKKTSPEWKVSSFKQFRIILNWKKEKRQAASYKLDNWQAWDYIRLNRKDNMKVKEAAAITGSMTRTSKMPGLSYSLPAWECKTGSKLRKIKNSVCSMCYALKGNYTRYKAIKAAQYVRLAALNDARWTAAMVTQVKRQKYFRWHDAGDVQDLQHLEKIFEVCRLTPETRHWMPTREAWIKDHLDRAPANLVIRFSPPMINQRNDSWPNSSMVVDKGFHTCPAPAQGGKCGSCRQCWDPAIKVVSYGKH